MRNVFLAAAVLSIVAGLAWRDLGAQTSYPVVGTPQGGDRRGGYSQPDEEAQKVYDETGALPRLYADPKIYLHNMTLLAHVPGRFTETGMMTIGGNRYLFGGGKVLDVTNPKEPVVINEKAPNGEIAYNQSLQKWILMQTHQCCGVELDVVQGGKPLSTLAPPPGTKLGVTFYDVSDPRNPVELSHFSTGPGSYGVHGDGVYYDGGRYAYLSSRLPGYRGQPPYEAIEPILQIIDVSDIRNPKEVSRWWVPGQKMTEENDFLSWPESGRFIEQSQEKSWSPDWKYDYLHFHGPCIPPKRVEDGGNRGYCSWSSLGMRILDFSDIRQPKLVGTADISPPFDAGIPVHSAYPMLERKLVFINGETTRWDCHEGIAIPWVVDVRAEKSPMVIAAFPIPQPPAEAPYNDFCLRGGRFGTHNPQEFKAPGHHRIDLMGYSWFQGGFRLYDVSNPFRPEEVAWIVPRQGERRGTEASFIEWDRNIIYVSSDTGLYIVSTPALGEPVLGPLKPERWNAEGLNIGAP